LTDEALSAAQAAVDALVALTLAPADQLEHQLKLAEARHNLIARLIDAQHVDEAATLAPQTITAYRDYAAAPGADIMRVAQDLAELAPQLHREGLILEADNVRRALVAIRAITPLFDAQHPARWLPQFGECDVSIPGAIKMTSGSPVGDRRHAEAHHAEAHCEGILGADFTYAAEVTADWANGTEAHVQFRISDEGRYGVRVEKDRATLYRYAVPERNCDDRDPKIFSPCPGWPGQDDLVFEDLKSVALDPGVSSRTVAVVAQGSQLPDGGSWPAPTSRSPWRTSRPGAAKSASATPATWRVCSPISPARWIWSPPRRRTAAISA
jgi:hypothetical protein